MCFDPRHLLPERCLGGVVCSFEAVHAIAVDDAQQSFDVHSLSVGGCVRRYRPPYRMCNLVSYPSTREAVASAYCGTQDVIAARNGMSYASRIQNEAAWG